MKLRVRGNTIRLRLTQEEVQTLGAGQPVMEKTDFGKSYFAYRLKCGQDWSAGFENGTITVQLPAIETKAWAGSDQVGLEHTFEWQRGDSQLFVLIEKDLQCLNSRSPEEDKGTFPHPNSGQQNC
jgi:hypothetical protein